MMATRISNHARARTVLLVSRLHFAAYAILLASAWSRCCPAGDWPQFLGPDRNGKSSETGLLDSLPDSGPKVVWRVPGGVGMSGLAIREGRLVTMVQRDGQQWLVAHDALTGEEQWKIALAAEYANPMGNGPRGTPAIVGDRVFVLTGEGILAAVRFADGQLLWSRDALKDVQGKTAEYGMACSPLVVGDQVLVTVGGRQGTVAAWDVQGGKLAWKSGTDPAGYSSPALLTVGGRQQIVASTGTSVLGLMPGTGTILWQYPFATNFQCNIATPLAIGDDLFISSGEDHGSARLSLKRRGKEYDVNEVWTSFGTQSVLRNEWQTSLLLDGYLFGMDNVGGAGPITHLTCIDSETGKRTWQKTRFGKGNLIAADGKLWISTMKGELVLVRATPEKYEELGRAVVIGSTRQAPALSHGMLYLRDDEEIVCLDVRASE